MSYSFSADAIQYSRDNAYYARDLTSGGGTVIPGPAEITGDLVVDGSILSTSGGITAEVGTGQSVSIAGAGGFPSVSFVNGALSTLIGLQSSTGPLLVGNNGVAVTMPGALNVAGAVTAGSVSAPSVTVGSAGSAGLITLVDGAGSGTISEGTISLNNNVVNISSNGTQAVLGPAGRQYNILGSLSVPSIVAGSLGFVQYPATNGESLAGFVIAGQRVYWGRLNQGVNPQVTFPVPFSAAPIVVSAAEKYNDTTPQYTSNRTISPTVAQFEITTSVAQNGEGIVWFIAIGPA